ncbi:hypothetical protein Ancab_031598, partial [Ancistrocladus abbreviatus]
MVESTHKVVDRIQAWTFGWATTRIGLSGINFHQWVANPQLAIAQRDCHACPS